MLIKETGYKINFIDKNDNFVGFDNLQGCCEDFGWLISKSETLDTSTDSNEQSEWCDEFYFDTSSSPKEIEWANDEDAAVVTFKMINDSGDVLFLHLYNHHNGYYAHGWDSSFGGEGCL